MVRYVDFLDILDPTGADPSRKLSRAIPLVARLDARMGSIIPKDFPPKVTLKPLGYVGARNAAGAFEDHVAAQRIRHSVLIGQLGFVSFLAAVDAFAKGFDALVFEPFDGHAGPHAGG
jgi:hypothetical protein